MTEQNQARMLHLDTDDTEGHQFPKSDDVDDAAGHVRIESDDAIDLDDTEGHRLVKSDDADDDVEGHKAMH